MKSYLSHRSTRWGYDGWALLRIEFEEISKDAPGQYDVRLWGLLDEDN